MARTATTDPQLIEDSSKTRELTRSINRLTLVLALLNAALILLTLPITIESLRALGW